MNWFMHLEFIDLQSVFNRIYNFYFLHYEWLKTDVIEIMYGLLLNIPEQELYLTSDFLITDRSPQLVNYVKAKI